MKYKGYTARVTFDQKSEVLYGEVVGLRDAIMFEARSVDDVRKSFHAAVDAYLDFCASQSEEPETPN